MPMREYRADFRTMGTQAMVLVVARTKGGTTAARALQTVRALFQREDVRFSRFRPDSEVSRLNAARGSASPSAEMWDVLQRAARWHEWTGGLFDPTVLGALERAGYDRDFALLDCVGAGAIAPPSLAHGNDIGARHVALTETRGRRAVRLDGGARLDLGGIVKGWTVDRAAELLAGFPGYLVDAGGDIRAGGDGLDGAGWCIAVEDPFDPSRDCAFVTLRDQAIATSGTYRRQWRRGLDGSVVHHLIDPRTGRPSESGVVSATVIASTAEAAEVLAKAALLAGPADGLALIEDAAQAEGTIVLADGARWFTSGWERHAPRPFTLVLAGEAL